jgi:hypothetical protein
MIEILNQVVKQCVLNQTRGYWLMFDVRYVTISIKINFQVEYNSRAPIFPPLTCENFDEKLKISYVKMVIEYLHVLQPFLAFCVKFDVAMAHNMMALMLNPKYKA